MRPSRITLASAALVCAACAGCVADEAPEPGRSADSVEAARAYVHDARARRQALEESIAVADTPYGRLRMDHYALGGAGIDDPARDWDQLPIRTPRAVRRLRVPLTEGDALPAPFAPEPLFDPNAGAAQLDELDESGELADFVEAGRRAFALFPIDVDPRFARLRRSAEVARSFGLFVAADGEVQGAAEVQGDDGAWFVALSCAACHSSAADDGTRVPGLPNPEFEFAELLGAPIFPTATMDVTADGVFNPVRPPDLRPLRHQARLHHAGNLGNGRIARMVRIETLIAGRSDFATRPDRRLVAAMALYLESLADRLTSPTTSAAARSATRAAGADAFRESCSGCHRGDAMAGPPIDADRVGTDPAATVGSSRGTGGYRAPSLLGVSERRGLLHDGSAPTLEALLGLEPSSHRGHPFGTELPESTRRAILAFLAFPGG